MEIDTAHYRVLLKSHELASQLYDSWAGDPWGESSTLFKNRFMALMDWIGNNVVDEEEDDEGGVCPDCSGSGMGATENSICRTCRGSGEV